MRFATIIAVMALSIYGASSYALAKTTSGTIRVSASIVPGTTVSVYVTANGVMQTIVRNDGQAASPNASLGSPAVAISFDTQPSWHLVKLVTFDKSRHLITVNF